MVKATVNRGKVSLGHTDCALDITIELSSQPLDIQTSIHYDVGFF